MILRILILALFVAGTTHASELRQVVYVFADRDIEWLPASTHVICNDCPPITGLKGIPVEDKLAQLRIMVPQKPVEEAVQPEVKAKEEEKESGCADQRETHTVYFTISSAELTDVEKERLKEFISKKKDGNLEVIGYTCSVGPQKFNDNLARRRAEAVSAYLESMGVKKDGIETGGKGKCCYTGGPKELDRRVEIKIKEETK